MLFRLLFSLSWPLVLIFSTFSPQPAEAVVSLLKPPSSYEELAKERLARPNPKDILSIEVKAKIRSKLEKRMGFELQKNPVQISVDGEKLKPAKTLDELILRLQEMLIRIEQGSHTSVAVEIESEKFYLHRKPLGEGVTGIVFQTLTESRVVKFPSPDVVGLNALLDEGFILPHVEKLEAAGLHVAEPLAIHPLGLYAIKRAAPPVNVTQVLLRSKLMHFEHGHVVRASAKEAAQILKHDPNLRAIAAMVMKMVKTRRSFDALNLDLGPANLHFEYNAIGQEHLVLVDTGRSGQSTKLAIDSIRSFDDYLTFAEGIMNRYVNTGIMRAGGAVTCSALFAPAA